MIKLLLAASVGTLILAAIAGAADNTCAGARFEAVNGKIVRSTSGIPWLAEKSSTTR